MSFEDIILRVKAHPEIWQTAHQHYRNRPKVRRTWKEISAELETDECTIKKRWKHLKDQYRKELKKVLSNQIPKSYWQFYKDMNFITDEILTSKVHTKKTDDPVNLASDSDTQSDEPKFIQGKFKSRAETTSNSMKTIKKPNKVSLVKQLKEIKELLYTRNKREDDELRKDADYLFLVSLLPTLRKLSDLQKLQFRGKVNEWLLEAITPNDYFQCDNKIYVQEQINAMQPEGC